MAEILKITTPVVNKGNAPMPARPVADPSIPFSLQDVQTVARPATQQEILQQNNGMIDKENSSSLLTGLLKDPAAAVSFMKSITILQEIVKLLPANNSTVTQEIEQLFSSLLIKPEDIAAELMNQETTSTAFRGELFTFLRALVGPNSSPEINSGVAGLLKSINSLYGRDDALNAVANGLKYLSESLAPSKDLALRLTLLAGRFRGRDAAQNFSALKKEALALLSEAEESLLFTSKLAKVNAITTYNLSRFNDNPDFLQETATNLFFLLNSSQRKEFQEIIDRFRARMGPQSNVRESKIMDVLTQIIGRQAGERELSASAAEKIEKIIYSLLSSPCHFTPLLHFVIPVEFDFIKSFAEIWINPNGEEDRRGDRPDAKSCIHMLLSFDIEGIGKFEMEIFTVDERVELLLFCPPAYRERFSQQADAFRKCINSTSYHIDKLRVEELKRQRSLMDVFKSLPYKRTGVNVKV